MAHFGKDLDNFTSSRTIKIIRTETNENVTLYVIEVTIGHYTWTVKHRYSDFYELNEKLVSSAKIDKSLLPPKKLFGNHSEAFIKKRQNELEVYLQTVLYFVVHKMPPSFASFLDFDKYEIHGVTQCMAEELYNRGDQLLQLRDTFVVTPLQLYSLTERLKLPEPTCESGDVKKDLGHILDFITRVKGLKVKGSKIPVGTSSIDMTQLKFDVSLFKSLNCLEFEYCLAANIMGIDAVKESLEKLGMKYGVKSIREILLHNTPQWKAEDGTLLVSIWENLVEADLSHNTIREIDDSVQLMPRIEVLDLSHNLLQSIQHLNLLSQLTHLDLSHNALSELDGLHTKLGNVKILKLTGNRLSSLQGLAKLFSLENLDVRDNKISHIPEVKYACGLPCIENLYLQGNPVNNVLDYRTKVLEMCGDRVIEVCLDGKKPSQKELDTVAVLQAIQKSKENKGKKPMPRKTSGSELSVSSESPCQGDTSGSQVGVGWNTQASTNDPKHDVGDKPQLPSSTHNPQSQTSKAAIKIDLSCEESGRYEVPTNSESDQPFLNRWGLFHSGQNPGLPSLLSVGSSGRPTHKTNLPSRSSRSTSQSSDESSNIPEVSIATLPMKQNIDFMTWLQKRLFGSDTENITFKESLLDIIWCSILQYTRQDVVLPSCAVLTERRVFLLRLQSGHSGFPGVPELETVYIMPLSNVQEVVIGPCYSYIRLEESFVGASGTFVLMVPDADVGKSFSDSLRVAYDVGDLGPSPIKNQSENSDLAQHIFSGEDEEGLSTGRLAFSMMVTVAGVEQLSLLVLSENKVYLVHSDCLFWPRPAFLSVLEDIQRPNFSYLQQHSVITKISDIKMNICLKTVGKRKRVSSIDSSKTPITFQQFGLSMLFHELIGQVGFHVSFPSVKSRDGVLDRLTTLRSEHAHRMSPTIREEPEGGNESTDSSDSTNDYLSVTGEHSASHLGEESKTDREEGEKNKATSDEMDNKKLLSECSSEVPVKPRSVTLADLSFHVTKPESDLTTVKDLDLMYVTKELEKHLENCIHTYNLVKPLPSKLKSLTMLSGRELVQYFHSDISMIGVDAEQLHYVMWCVVVPYCDPKKEIVTCVMLSTRAIYLVSNQLVRSPVTERQSWMTHSRHKSDSVLGIPTRPVDHHHSSGILHSGHHSRTIVRSYFVWQYSDLPQLNVGLFDQCIRLTGHDQNSVYTLLTRDSTVTEKLLHQITTMLSIFTASPMLEKSSSDLEHDFYRAFDKRTKTTVEGMEYVHPSRVLFVYPGEDVMADLLYTITEHLRLPTSAKRKADILMYLLCYQATVEHHVGSADTIEGRSLVLTNQYICLISEDLVSYPLPDFVRGLPNTPRYSLTDTIKLDHLKRVLLFKDNEHKITLIYSDEPDEICVDTTSDHFSLENNSTGRHSPPEVGVTLLVQCKQEINKFVTLLTNQYRDLLAGLELEMHTL